MSGEVDPVAICTLAYAVPLGECGKHFRVSVGGLGSGEQAGSHGAGFEVVLGGPCTIVEELLPVASETRVDL